MGQIEKLTEGLAGVAGAALGAAAAGVAAVGGRLVPGSSVKPHSVMGTGTTCLLSGRDTGENFAMFRIDAYPGQGVPLHRHDREDETFYVVHGQARVELDGESTILNPGDSAHLKKGHAHAWFVHGEQPLRLLLLVHPAGMDHFFPEIARRVDGTDPSLDEIVATSRRFGIHFV